VAGVPPYVSTMILRPVSPASPIGPPISNRPVGLTRQPVAVGLQAQALDLGGDDVLADVGVSSDSSEMSGACWLETTTVFSRTGPQPVVLDGHLGLAVGAQVRDGPVAPDRGEAAGQPVRQRDRQRHQLGVSEQAKPNIMPWSPAPCASSALSD
jgi:hypothetical protein